MTNKAIKSTKTKEMKEKIVDKSEEFNDLSPKTKRKFKDEDGEQGPKHRKFKGKDGEHGPKHRKFEDEDEEQPQQRKFEDGDGEQDSAKRKFKGGKQGPIKRKFEDEDEEDGLKQRKFEDEDEEEDPKQRKFEDEDEDGEQGPAQDKSSGDGQKKSSEKPDWKKLKLEKKELKMKRKQKSGGGNEVYELSVSAKKIWEEVRREDCTKERKAKLSTELYNLVRGKVKSLIYAHDTVRVIEALFSAGDENVRANLFEELKDDILNLAKNKYSRFFVLKILRSGTKMQKEAVINAMMTHVVKLMNHKIACDVLEVAYNDCANAKQRSYFIQEFFGPRFTLFKEDLPTLEAAVKKYPDQKEKILADVNLALQPILTKGVFTNVLVHTLLKEYLYVCSEEDKRTIIDAVREGLLPILHTRDGARVAMLCLWNGTMKDKKVIVKSFRGNIVKMAMEKHGHMVLLAAFDSVDDTVLVSKVILSEIIANLNVLMENENGKRVLRYLVAPRFGIFFHRDIVSILEEGDGSSTSKKDRTVKYKELQAYVAQPILKLIHENIKTWASDSHWTLFIGSALQTFHDDSIKPVFESLAEICAETYMPGDDTHFLEIAYMSKMISFIIQCDKERHAQNNPLFSTYLIDAAESEMKGWCLTNRGCFVMVKLLETEIPDIVEKVLKICSSVKSKLRKLNFPGAEVLLKKLVK